MSIGQRGGIPLGCTLYFLFSRVDNICLTQCNSVRPNAASISARMVFIIYLKTPPICHPIPFFQIHTWPSALFRYMSKWWTNTLELQLRKLFFTFPLPLWQRMYCIAKYHPGHEWLGFLFCPFVWVSAPSRLLYGTISWLPKVRLAGGIVTILFEKDTSSVGLIIATLILLGIGVIPLIVSTLGMIRKMYALAQESWVCETVIDEPPD